LQARKPRTQARNLAKALYGPSHAKAVFCQFFGQEYLPMGFWPRIL
jgi:hypothetical protein